MKTLTAFEKKRRRMRGLALLYSVARTAGGRRWIRAKANELKATREEMREITAGRTYDD
jgi:hypothetical protein